MKCKTCGKEMSKFEETVNVVYWVCHTCEVSKDGTKEVIAIVK